MLSLDSLGGETGAFWRGASVEKISDNVENGFIRSKTYTLPHLKNIGGEFQQDRSIVLRNNHCERTRTYLLAFKNDNWMHDASVRFKFDAPTDLERSHTCQIRSGEFAQAKIEGEEFYVQVMDRRPSDGKYDDNSTGYTVQKITSDNDAGVDGREISVTRSALSRIRNGDDANWHLESPVVLRGDEIKPLSKCEAWRKSFEEKHNVNIGLGTEKKPETFYLIFDSPAHIQCSCTTFGTTENKEKNCISKKAVGTGQRCEWRGRECVVEDKYVAPDMGPPPTLEMKQHECKSVHASLEEATGVKITYHRDRELHASVNPTYFKFPQSQQCACGVYGNPFTQKYCEKTKKCEWKRNKCVPKF